MDVENLLSKDLLDSLASLEAPKHQRFSEGEAYITKILKDKQKLRIANEKRQRQEEAFRQQQEDDSDVEEGEEEAAAKKARFEESKANLQEKIRAQAGPPIFKKALLPVQDLSTELPLDLPAEEHLSAFSSTQLGEKIDRPTLMRELLKGGWLQQAYSRHYSMSAEIQQELFAVASQSPELEVAQRAYEILNGALSSALHAGKHPTPALGVQEAGGLLARSHKAAKPRQDAASKEDGASTANALPGWEDPQHPPKFHNLQMVMRLLRIVCMLQAAGLCDSLAGAGAVQLLLTTLALRLDPACNLLGVDLEVAAGLLVEAIPASDWTRKFQDLSAQVARLGGSHRGALEVIRLMAGQGERAELLRSHAIAHVLPTLLKHKGSKPSKPSKCRGEPKPIDPEALVNAQNWFEDGLGYTALAKDVRLGLVNIWELRSTIELVDILLWPAVKASKETGEELACKSFVAKWHLFLQKVGNHMNKDNEGASLKLLITTIITRNNPSCV